MNLGLFRKEHLQSAKPDLIGNAVIDQFQRTHGAIGAWVEAEHDDSGGHTDINPDSIVVGPNGAGGSWDAAGNINAPGTEHTLGEFTFRSGPAQTSESMTIGIPEALEAWRVSRIAGTPGGGSGYSFALTDLAQPTFAAMRLGLFAGSYYAMIPHDMMGMSLGITGLTSSQRMKYVAVNDGYYERGRTPPMGEWTSIPYNAAHFTAQAGTWTVSSANMLVNRYMLIGKTLFWNVTLSGTTLSSTPQWLEVLLPAGLTAQTYSYCRVGLVFNGGAWGIDSMANVNPADTKVMIRRTSLANFAAGATECYFNFTMEIP